MAIPKELAAAVKRAEIKRQVSDLLAQLSATERKMVLADLFTEHDATSPRRSSEDSPSEDARASTGRRRTADTATSKKDQLHRLLCDRPGIPISEMALEIYDTDDALAMRRIRAILVGLKKQGRVTNRKRGIWKGVTRPK
jgi:hypothetical protein